jgi:hypothetical protein
MGKVLMDFAARLRAVDIQWDPGADGPHGAMAGRIHDTAGRRPALAHEANLFLA